MQIVDTTAPEITLIGENPLMIEIGSVFTDPGATCSDNYDAVCSVTSSGSVNTNILGISTIEYTATDNAGNTITVTRSVEVIRAGSSGGTPSYDRCE